jgi:hypothetical protein
MIQEEHDSGHGVVAESAGRASFTAAQCASTSATCRCIRIAGHEGAHCCRHGMPWSPTHED